MPVYTTSNGRTINSNLSHTEAADICRRIPQDHPDYGFARSLANYVANRRPLSSRQVPYLHLFAIQQLTREQETTNNQLGQIEADAAPVVDRDFWINLRPHLLNYDIPSNRTDILNPSNRLRRIGIRLTLSCWLMAEGDLPYSMLRDMTAPRAFPVVDAAGVQVIGDDGRPIMRTRRGAKWHVVPFDPNSAEALVNMATEALRQEIKDAVRRAYETAQSASERIEECEGDPVKAQKRFDADVAKINETLAKTLSDLEAAATRFGIDVHSINIHNAKDTADTLRTALDVRVRLYTEATSRARLIGGTGRAIAEAVDRGSMSPLVMADWLEEEGEEELGQALRSSFQQV